MTNDSAKPISETDFDRPQPIDIVTRLRQTRANMLGTDDEAHYWDCHDAAAEIERLRAVADRRGEIAVNRRREIDRLRTIMCRIVDEDCTVAIQNGKSGYMNAPDEPLATAMAQAAYYARRAGYLEGAMLVISWGTSGVDPQEAARRALAAVGEDEYARPLKNFDIHAEGTCPPSR